VLAVVVAIALVTTSLAAYLKFRSVWDSITRINVVGLGHRPPQLSNAMNVLLIGSDSRAGQNEHFGAGITGQRSDTIIVLHIAPGEHNVVALSIPRDSVVPILYCPAEAGTAGQKAQPGQVEQINATFAAGGPGCLWKTIEQTTHLRLDHFIELDFTGFEKVIDDIGGVSICLPFPVHDPQSRLNLTAGRHHVWGAEALAFWRARYIGEGSDLQRIQRDQYLMAALLQGIERSHLDSSPTRLLTVVTDAARYMTTDSGLSLGVMTSIADSLRGLRPGAVQFIELPTAAYGPDPDWVSWPASDAQLFGAIARDQRISTADGTPRARPTSLGSVHAGLSLTAAVRAGAAPHDDSGPGGPGNLYSRYGGITGAAKPCADRKAFAGPRGGS
jgi:LCP family protein required for cell wall assembly